MVKQTGEPEDSEITVRQLRTLIAVAQARSYRIGDKPSASKVIAVRSQLARLAKVTGNPDEALTTTDGRGEVRLTRYGRTILPYAEAVVGMVDKLHRPNRLVGVAVYSSLMLHILTQAAARGMNTDSESLGFWFAPADAARADGGAGLIRQLVRHDVDVAVAPDRLAIPSDLQEDPLYFWELKALGAFPPSELSTAGGQPTISIQQLAEYPLLVSPDGYRSRQVLEEAARRAKVPLKIRFELADQGLMQRLTKAAPDNDPWIAIMPSDAYGVPEADDSATVEAAVAIVGADGILGDSYSIYRRRQAANIPTEFEQRVDAAARTVADLLDPATWPGAVKPPVRRRRVPPRPGPAPRARR